MPRSRSPSTSPARLPPLLLLLGVLLLLLAARPAIAEDAKPPGSAPEKAADGLAKLGQKPPPPAAGSKNITSKQPAEPAAASVTTVQPALAVQNVNELDVSSINVGALKRAIIVTFGLCGIVVAYIAFRSFRVNNSRPQMVRKYGILAHRQDVEMRPLPLDEDDEDDTTVFDASSISQQRLQA